jgi:hypothetical protein
MSVLLVMSWLAFISVAMTDDKLRRRNQGEKIAARVELNLTPRALLKSGTSNIAIDVGVGHDYCTFLLAPLHTYFL